MAHYLINGMTGSGKTTLGVALARQYRRRRMPVAVLDPMFDDRWDADFKTDNLAAFDRFVWRRKGYFLFIDEAGLYGKFDESITALLTRGRHLGHSVTLISQDATQVSPLMRGQAATVYLFASTRRSIERIAVECDQPSLLTAPKLQPFEFWKVSRFVPPTKFKLDIRSLRGYAI